MFWHMMGGFDSPQIDNLLERENLTLTELLDEDQLLNELVHRNDKLIQYLCKEEVLKEMIEFIITDSTYTEHSLDDMDEYTRIQLKYKRANQVTELLNTDNEEVSKKIVESEDLLNLLMSILETNELLNPLLACFFSKVVGSLLKQHPEETWCYLKNRENLINDIIKHMQTSGIADFIMRLVACSSDNEQVRSEIIAWMVDEDLVEKLIDLLNKEENNDSDVHTYASTALCELISILRQENSEAARCPLLNRLTQTSTIEKVIAQMLVSPLDASVFVSAGEVLSTYMEKVQRANLYPWADDNTADYVSYYASAAPAVDVLANHVPRLLKILHNPPVDLPIALPSGVLDPPLGKVRLHIIQLISESLPQKMKSFFNSIIETNLIETILDLFFKYDNNSFLSGYVYQIICDVFECDFEEESLIVHFLDDCQVLERFTDGWLLNTEEELQGRPRKGYMGHLYNILKLLITLSELHNDVEEQHSSHLMFRNRLIQAHLNKMSEEKKSKWEEVKVEIEQMTELLSRNLGRTRKLEFNSSGHSDQTPTSAAEDALARYQQKISTEFDDHFNLEDPFELNPDEENDNDPIDRDDLLDNLANELSTAQNSESMFEKMIDEKESDWFGENEPDYKKEKEVTLTIETPTECATEIQPEKIHESVEKMDTSQSAESSPWPVEIKNDVTEAADTHFANFDSSSNFANFESEFGQPTLSSSPQKLENNIDPGNLEKMETDSEPIKIEKGEGDGSLKTAADVKEEVQS